MTQEDKQLLFQDLCARLPYKIKALFIDEYDEDHDSYSSFVEAADLDGFVTNFDGTQYPIDQVRPYLLPISSMNKEQIFEFNSITLRCNTYTIKSCSLIDFCNRNHIDYRNLIGKGLAIDATGLNIYKEEIK